MLLSYFNVAMDDDIVMFRSVKEHGVLAATIGQYQSWNTRWMSFFFLHTWMYYLNENSSLLFYHLITFIALFLASLRLVKACHQKGFLNSTSVTDTYFSAGLISAALLASTYHIGDTWFWLNTSTMYGWNLIAILFSLSLAILPLKNNFLHDSMLTFLGLYVGGASEPSVASLFVLLPVFLVVKKTESAPYRKDSMNFLIGMGLSFAIALAGEGHGKRDAALPDLQLGDWLIKSIYFSSKIVLYHSPLRVIMALLLLYPLFNRTTFSSAKNSFFYYSRNASIAWIIIVVIHVFFITSIMGDYGPERAWSFISLWTVLVSGWWWYHVAHLISEKVIKGLCWPLAFYLIFIVLQQYRLIPPYIAYIHKVQQGELPFDATKIPDSGLLHPLNGNY